MGNEINHCSEHECFCNESGSCPLSGCIMFGTVSGSDREIVVRKYKEWMDKK